MKINEKYILVFEIQGKILTYTARIIEENETTVKFSDKFNKEFEYNKRYLISSEEVQ
jgi:hypothetical protein